MPGLDDALERLVTDREFRSQLRTDPKGALAGYDLTASDLDMLAAQISDDEGGGGSVEARTSKAGFAGHFADLFDGAPSNTWESQDASFLGVPDGESVDGYDVDAGDGDGDGDADQVTTTVEEFDYNEAGRVIEHDTETESSDSPNLLHADATVMDYNDLGDVVEEEIVDHEPGVLDAADPDPEPTPGLGLDEPDNMPSPRTEPTYESELEPTSDDGESGEGDGRGEDD
ncbi:MAG: hypothetical protein HYU28_04745 [Actinobacteria bacterium]|nr:hypothetical protein [Actinomycetota bacterium]